MHADPDVPGSEQVSAALLEPLAAWESRSAGSSGDAVDTTETTAAPPTAAPPEEEPLADPA